MVEVRDSFTRPVSDQFARTAAPLHASVRVGEEDCYSQCAVRFPKTPVGVTSGD